MCRIACIVACCVLSWTVWAGESTGYLGSLDTNPVVPTTLVVNTSNNKVYVGGISGASVKVKVLNAANGQVTELNVPGITTIRSMTYDPVSNQIFIVNTSSVIAVIDCDTDTVRATNINIGFSANNAYASGIDPINRKLYIATGDSANDIVIVDIATQGGETVSFLDATATLSTVAVFPMGNRAYMGSFPGGGGNRVVEAPANSIFLSLNVGNNEDALALAMAGPNLFAATNAGRIYYKGPGTGGTQILGGTDATLIGSGMPAATDGDDLNCMAYNSVLDKMYIGNTNKGRVYVIGSASTGTPTLSTTLNITQPKSIAINPNTGRVFITSSLTQVITVDGTDDSVVTFDTSVSSVNTVAINTVTNRVFVPESSSPKVHVYDGAVNKVTTKDSAGASAYNFSSTLIATNSTTGFVYAVDVGMGMQATSTVRQINGTTVLTGTAGSMPVDIGINEISNKIYVANQTSSTVTRFDGNAFGGTPKNIPLTAGGLTGQNPVALAVDSTVNRIFVANRGPGMGASGNISVIYGGADEVIATLPLDGEPTAICVLPGRSKLYVATTQNGQGFVSVFSTLENKFIKKLSVQEAPQQLLPAGTDRIYVSSLTSAAVQAIDTAGDNVIGAITCGNSNNIMAYNRSNGMLYVVSRSSSGNLTAIDVQSNSTRQAPSSAGSSPASIVASPSGNRVYIGQQSGAITVLDGGVNPFFLTQINSFNTQGLLNGLSIDTARSKLYIAGVGFRAVDLESGMFDPTAPTLVGSSPALYFNNNPEFTLNANGGAAVYYQLNSTQGTWTRSGSGMLVLSAISAGSHHLFAYSTKDEDATTGSFPQGSNTPTIGKIDVIPFVVHDGGIPLPTLNTIEDQVINEDQSQVSIDFFGVTPGPLATVFSAANITFVTSNSNPVGLVSIVSPVDFDSTRGKGTLKITPTANLFGDVFITVRVTDPTSIPGIQASQLTITRTFKLTVQPVNDAPAFNVGANITVSEAAVESSTAGFISGIVLGPANESTQAVSEYIVTAAQTDQFKVQPAIDNTGTLKFTPANNSGAATPVSINVQLKDNGGTTNNGSDTSAIRTFTITLTPIADSLVVTNTTDSATANSNSLRDCMTRARAGDTITFDSNIFDLTNSNAATVINVTGGGLPTLNDGNVTIDASERRVTINGSGTVDASGILIGSSNNVIRGLSIVGFPGPGLRIQGASNIIGGARTSGAGPNGQGLRISGNGSFGLEIRGTASTANMVKGCWIGLDAAGTSAEANLAGILIQDGARGNTIGGAGSGEANVIGGNKFEGTTFSGSGTDDNVFVGNEVGISAVASSTSSSSTVSRREDSPIATRSAIGNGSAGLFLSRGTAGSKVGGDSDTDSNVVANNGGNGVEVRASGSRRNAAKKNRISKNKSGGIALFDNANDGITAPTFVSVTELTPTTSTLSRAAVRVAITGTSSTTTGTVEIFNDSGSQGETFVTRATVSAGTWSTEVDVSDVLNITATLTDDSGNTSAFAVFGRSPGDDSSVDTDGDGISDALETLAGTDPNSATSVPTSGGALIVDKLQIGLNFTKADKDSLKSTIRLVLPTGFINTDAVIAVQFADSSESVTLTSKGSGPKGLVTVKLTGGSTTAAAANTGGKITYAIAKKTLLSSLQSAGLDNETTAKEGETLTIPVGVAITSGTTKSVYTGTVTVIYKATTGKTGKAKQSL